MSEWASLYDHEGPPVEEMTPRGYGIWFAATAANIGLPAENHGAIVCEDREGGRWTLAGTDTEYVELMAASVREGVVRSEAPVALSSDQFPLIRAGWYGVDW